MKIIYSELKKLIPDLSCQPQKLMEDLTLIGHFVNGIENKNKETVFSLEIRQNRADCLGYWGIAKELATLYGLELKNPELFIPETTASSVPLPIEVKAPEQVVRIMAAKIISLRNSSSPLWLKKFLNLHDINSINTLVDLTNYIMLIWGIPNHAFDAQKSTDKITWETSQEEVKIFTTFDGTSLSLKKGTLQISNKKEVLSLAGIIGGKSSGVTLDTKESIVEMAIYNPKRVRLDSQQLKITTEASSRLEKQLDPNLIPSAFSHLINLIMVNCQGKLNGPIYDYYPNPIRPPTISFNIQSPSIIAGIKIDNLFSLKTLKKIGCQIISSKAEEQQIIPPSSRPDLEMEEDLVEEVVRFFGYQNIPTHQPISAEFLSDITPKILHLIEAVQNNLVNLGYDEIRSWPLIKKNQFLKAWFLPEDTEGVYTQNNINSHYPLLRSSILSSLKNQKRQYQKLKVPQQRFFEIGKIFYKTKRGDYKECWSLGIFDQSNKRLNKKLSYFYKKLGLLTPPQIYPLKTAGGFMVEIDLERLAKQLGQTPRVDLLGPPQFVDRAAKELTSQIISLDVNLTLKKEKPSQEIIRKYQNKFDPNIFWQLAVIDLYQEGGFYKYTLRAFYYNCSAKEAKEHHQKIFST